MALRWSPPTTRDSEGPVRTRKQLYLPPGTRRSALDRTSGGGSGCALLLLSLREERQTEDETGRNPQAGARLALESLDGLLARMTGCRWWGMGSLATLMPVAS